MEESIENLKSSVTCALVAALENQHVSLVKQLFNIYSEVQQIKVPYNYSFNMNSFNYTDTITNFNSPSSSDFIKI